MSDLLALTYDEYYSTNQNKSNMSNLIEFTPSKPSQGRVLDIGVGTGCNSLHLAKLGYQIEGVDISEVDIKMTQGLFRANNLIGDFSVRNAVELSLRPNSYDIILWIMTAHYMPLEAIGPLSRKIKNALTKKGLVLFSILSTKDSQYGIVRTDPIGRFIQTFMEPTDVLALFDGLRTLRIKEYTTPFIWQRHLKTRSASLRRGKTQCQSFIDTIEYVGQKYQL